MKDAGVKTISVSGGNTVTGTAVALITPDSERTFATHLGAAVELNAEDLKQDVSNLMIFFILKDILFTTYRLLKKHAGLPRRKK